MPAWILDPDQVASKLVLRPKRLASCPKLGGARFALGDIVIV